MGCLAYLPRVISMYLQTYHGLSSRSLWSLCKESARLAVFTIIASSTRSVLANATLAGPLNAQFSEHLSSGVLVFSSRDDTLLICRLRLRPLITVTQAMIATLSSSRLGFRSCMDTGLPSLCKKYPCQVGPVSISIRERLRFPPSI